MRQNATVYENVIVPFDGSEASRAALAPAADLAWRCGARIVVVNNTEVNDAAGRSAIKSRAMSMSGADVDFWVDTQHELGEALVEASKFRADPAICISLKGKASGLRRKFALTSVAEQVLGTATVPVMVIGPQTDTSRGLPLIELVVTLDGSPASEQILPVAVDWARVLKLRVILVGVVSAGSEGPHAAEAGYLRGHAEALAGQVPEVTFELVKAPDPIEGIVGFLEEHEDAVVAMSTHGKAGMKGVLGGTAFGVVSRSPRAVVLRRPVD